MKQILTILSMMCLSLSVYSQDLTEADQIIAEYKKSTSIRNLKSTLTYKNISKKGKVQERKLEQFILKNNNGVDTYNLLLKFVSPRDVRNTSTLTIQHETKEDDQWLYLPVIRSAKKISSSKKSDRFMGTEMSYEDLSNYLIEPSSEYDYVLLGIEEAGENNTYRIEAIPKANANTQYSKRELWIDTDNFVLIRSDFYDKKGQLLKRYSSKDVRIIGTSDKYRAHEVILENLQTLNKTQVFYENFEINEDVDKGIFTKSYIETL